MKISYMLIAELIEFITENIFKTNNVNKLIKKLKETEGFISSQGGKNEL